jgi:large subunit ribosomal protein L17
MKHRVQGRKLGRTSAHRLALLRNLSTALFERERIQTTLMKAKELRPFAERLVTLSKRESLHARRQVLRHIHDRDVVAKLFETLSARFAQRPGGYTRILKLGPRRGDNAEMAIIELVGSEPAAKKKADGKGRKGKAAAHDHEHDHAHDHDHDEHDEGGKKPKAKKAHGEEKRDDKPDKKAAKGKKEEKAKGKARQEGKPGKKKSGKKSD